MIPQSSSYGSQRGGRDNNRGNQSWRGNSPHTAHFNSPYDSTIPSSRFHSSNSPAYGTPRQGFPTQWAQQRPRPHFIGSSPGAMCGSPWSANPDRRRSGSSQWTPRFGSPRTPARFTYKSPQMNTSLDSSGEYSDGKHRDSFGSPYRNSSTSEQFDVRDYVIPEMTSNPWAELEKQYYAELAQKQS